MTKCASIPPSSPGMSDLVHFNVIFAHLFSCLSAGQDMSPVMDVNSFKLLTVTTLIDGTFPAIKDTEDKRTPKITLSKDGYIHALMIHSGTLLHSDPPNARASAYKSKK